MMMPAEHDRHEHMSDAGHARQARDPGERVAACTANDRQGNPMVGQDGMTEADTGCRGQQSWGCGAHAENARSEGRDARPRRRCSA